VRDSEKPKGRKRPRGWHRGPNQDRDWRSAADRLGEAA
jgi:hypothetical protein